MNYIVYYSNGVECSEAAGSSSSNGRRPSIPAPVERGDVLRVTLPFRVWSSTNQRLVSVSYRTSRTGPRPELNV